MAALSIGPLFHCKRSPIMICSSRCHSRTIISCQNRKKNGTKTGKDVKEERGLLALPQLIAGVEKLGKVVQNNLSPKRKGDWKDITLMSLSFAVYVYMSQKIVCAYCAWMSMSGQPW